MNHFHYKGSELFCEEVPVAQIADKVGTPFYLYSYATLKHHFLAFDGAFKNVPHLVCFASKANSNIAILRLFASLGAGLDIVSGGELYRGLKAGVPGQRVVFSGVGKREDEISYALESNILMFNVESLQELGAIERCAARLGRKAPISFRVNPDVDPKTHSYISTGLKKNKFGLGMDAAAEAYRAASKNGNFQIVGMSCHIGSQITKVEPFVDALNKIKGLITTLKDFGITIKYLDLGGGLGIAYDEETPPHPNEYGKAILDTLGGSDYTLVFEPGRVLVGNAGVLVTRVLYTKAGADKHFVIVDSAMNDLMRPSLYGAYHEISPVFQTESPRVTADVVGPICESGDFLAKDREMPSAKPGDLLSVHSAGAYGFSMSSNYNSRPRVAEVMVKDNEFFVIRQRETYETLVSGEAIPHFLPVHEVA